MTEQLNQKCNNKKNNNNNNSKDDLQLRQKEEIARIARYIVNKKIAQIAAYIGKKRMARRSLNRTIVIEHCCDNLSILKIVIRVNQSKCIIQTRRG